MNKKEQRQYLIMLEALKRCPAQLRLEKLENVVHGKDGNNGLKSKVANIKGAMQIISVILTGVVLYIISINLLF